MDRTEPASTAEPKSTLRVPSSPSVARSRSRRQQFTDDEVQPLLANLSPTATLDALMTTSAVAPPTDQRRSFIKSSVENASETERAWGIRAALAGKKIREWLDELQGWPWTKGTLTGFEGEWDCKQVEEYVQRIEMIRDDMETLRVEDLKDHVRETHLKSENSETEYGKLEDFTAIITATIVQTLPPLLHLDGLLKAWSVRLTVLQRKSAFLHDLKNCKESMNSAWIAIGQLDGENTKPRPDFTRQTFAKIRDVLQDLIAQLGRGVDGMLDLLEGSKDVLPDQWIDTVDQLEGEYSSWVVKAEELALNNELGSPTNCENDQTKPVEDNSGMTIDIPSGQCITAESLDTPHNDIFDGANECKLLAPFNPTTPPNEPSVKASNTSRSSDANSDLSRPGSSSSSSSSGRSSVEIMSASVATNPGSPVRVTTPVRQYFQQAEVQQFGSVKPKDIRRLVFRRSDSCPSLMPPAANDSLRRRSVSGRSLASEPAAANPTDQASEETPATVKNAEQDPEPSTASSVPVTQQRTPSPIKSGNRFENYEDYAPGSASIKVQKQRISNQAENSSACETAASVSPKKHKDKLEARISSILDHIPADIRLKSSGAKTPPSAQPPARPKTPLRRSITPKLLRSLTPTPTSSPSLTLAPATDPGPKAINRSVHEPETRLYHLQQSSSGPNGKESTPVKLYVRLVGADGERVMVRVGGGWSDLGEYLREYALHHGASSGKRSVSDFQIQNLPTPGSASTTKTGQRTPKSRPGSRPGSRQSYFVDGEEPPPSPSPFVVAPSALGLAGPKTKNMPGMETGKQALVDDVLTKANGSGKVGGGIRRVFLRRRSTLGEKEAKA